MSLEIVVAGAALMGVLFTGGGLAFTIRKNGTSQAKRDRQQAVVQAARDAEVATNQQAILARLDDKDSGLQAVNIKMAKQATHCATISTALTERVANHGREIAELKAK